jgi:hypothetical protein
VNGSWSPDFYQIRPCTPRFTPSSKEILVGWGSRIPSIWPSALGSELQTALSDEVAPHNPPTFLEIGSAHAFFARRHLSRPEAGRRALRTGARNLESPPAPSAPPAPLRPSEPRAASLPHWPRQVEATATSSWVRISRRACGQRTPSRIPSYHVESCQILSLCHSIVTHLDYTTSAGVSAQKI